jgi:hypothetical protein
LIGIRFQAQSSVSIAYLISEPSEDYRLFSTKTIGCNSTNRRSGLVSFDTETGRLLNPYQARSREVIDHVLGAFSTGLIIQGHTTNEAPKNSRARMDNEERTAVKHNFLAFINRNGSELWRTSISSNLVLSQAKLSIDMKKLGLIASRRKGHVTTPTVGEREVWVVGAQSGEVLADVDLPPSTSTPIPVSPGLGTILTCYDPGFCYWTSASELVFISAGLSGILDTQRPEAEGGKELSSTRYELLDSTPRLRESYDAITSMLIDARPVTLPTTRIANGVFLHLSREGELFGSDNHNRDFRIKDVRVVPATLLAGGPEGRSVALEDPVQDGTAWIAAKDRAAGSLGLEFAYGDHAYEVARHPGVFRISSSRSGGHRHREGAN